MPRKLSLYRLCFRYDWVYMVDEELSRVEKREVYIRVKVGFIQGPESIVRILIDLETVLADPATATDPG